MIARALDCRFRSTSMFGWELVDGSVRPGVLCWVSGLALQAQVKPLVPPTSWLSSTRSRSSAGVGSSGIGATGAPRRPVRFYPPTSPSVTPRGGQEARRHARHAAGDARNGLASRDERARLTAPWANLYRR